MCIICDRTYTSQTTGIMCCTNVNTLPDPNKVPRLNTLVCNNKSIKVIPNYYNLVTLNCSNTDITELPNIKTLKYLFFSNTQIEHIPYIEELRQITCSGTKICVIPSLPKLNYIFAPNCPRLSVIRTLNVPINYYKGSHWINPKKDRIEKLVRIQRWYRKMITKRVFVIRLKLVKFIPVDVVNICCYYIYSQTNI